MWASETTTAVSSAVSWATLLRIAHNAREKEEEEPKLTSLTSTLRKICSTKEAKQKEAEWH
jgi:hypothetical protein